MSTREIDPKWDKVCKLVDIRDGRRCQFDKCLSIKESHQLIISEPKRVDRCHILSRSLYPELIYNINNIITLSRYIHRRMDNFENPLNGSNLDDKLHFYWWYRILFHRIEKFNEDVDYKELLLNKIK